MNAPETAPAVSTTAVCPRCGRSQPAAHHHDPHGLHPLPHQFPRLTSYLQAAAATAAELLRGPLRHSLWSLVCCGSSTIAVLWSQIEAELTAGMPEHLCRPQELDQAPLRVRLLALLQLATEEADNVVAENIRCDCRFCQGCACLHWNLDLQRRELERHLSGEEVEQAEELAYRVDQAAILQDLRERGLLRENVALV